MARSRFAITVGSPVLLVALLSTPGTLQAQSTGVLQASVRVVDFGASVAGLQAARAAVTSTPWFAESPAARPFVQPVVEVTEPAGDHRTAALRSDPVQVTINYLR